MSYKIKQRQLEEFPRDAILSDEDLSQASSNSEDESEV